MANKNEEIDLFYVFDKIRDFYHGMLANFYRFVQFLKKYWWILLIIIVGGYFAGQFWQRSLRPMKEAVLIVQNNFGSTNYVYNAIEILNIKSKQEDEAFLKQYGFNPEEPEIKEVTIEPVVSVMDLLEKSEPNDRNIDTYMSRIDFEEEILLSEIFYPEYHYHKIIIQTESRDAKLMDKVMAYLNSNEKFNKIQEVMYAETQLRIQRNDTTIAKIDALMDEYSGKNDRDIRPSEVYNKTIENNNMHHLLEKKTDLIKENEYLKTELTKYDQVVTVINNPRLAVTSKFLDKKRYLIPIGLLFLFTAYFVLKGWYQKGKKYSKK